MAIERANDLKAFRDFADAKLSNGGAELTLDEAIALWDIENHSDEEREDTIRAIQEGLADVEAGRVMDARDAVNEIRRKFGFAELP